MSCLETLLFYWLWDNLSILVTDSMTTLCLKPPPKEKEGKKWRNKNILELWSWTIWIYWKHKSLLSVSQLIKFIHATDIAEILLKLALNTN